MSSQAQVNPFFTPTQISSCGLWLDASDPSSVILSGSNVIQWNDKSGRGYNAVQTTSNYYPRYNLSTKTIFFTNDGTNPQWLDVPAGMQNTQDVSIFAVVSWTQYSTSGTTFMDKRKSLSYIPLYQIGGGGVVFRDNSLLTAVVWTFSQNTNSIIGIQGALNTERLYLNGTTAGSSNSTLNMPATDSNTFRIGALNEVIGNIANIRTYSASSRVNEVLVYNSFLSLSQRQQVEGYLAWKWGLQASLPATHPYKRSPIPPLLSPPVSIPRSIQKPFFTPTQISGCSLWLDAADASTVVLSGSNVTQWNDKSGNGRNASGGVSPTYSLNAVNFNGSSYLSTSLSAGSNNASYFIVFLPLSVGWLMGGNVNNTFTVGPFTSAGTKMRLSDWISNVVVNSTSITLGSSYFISASSSSGTQSLGVNGGDLSTGSATFSGVGTFTIGAGFTDNRGKINGSINEIIAFNSSLTTSQRQQVEGYLAWKWGLQASLPATHPYKTSPISPLLNPPIIASKMIFSSWSPLQISGCQLWMDGADVNGNGIQPVNGSSVSLWRDKSGNSRNATQSGTNRPTYVASTKSLRFTASNTQYMLLPDGTLPSGNNSYFIFFVFNLKSSGTFGLIYGGASGAVTNGLLGAYAQSSKVAVTWHLNDLPTTSSVYTVGVTNIYETSYVSAGQRVQYTNGSFDGSDTPGTRNSGTGFNRIGSFYNNNLLPLDAEVFEIIVYTTVTSSQRQQVEGYLAWKWGLQGSLPATHPYKKWPPPP